MSDPPCLRGCAYGETEEEKLMREAIESALRELRLYGGTYGTGDDAVIDAREVLAKAVFATSANVASLLSAGTSGTSTRRGQPSRSRRSPKARSAASTSKHRPRKRAP